MKPISPVMPGETFQEIIVAEHQDEYLNLPVINCGDGVILSRWELSDEEIKTISETRSVWLFMHTFGNPVTPVSLQVEQPAIENEPPRIDIIIAPRWSVSNELNATRLGVKIFKKICQECRLTVIIAESTFNQLQKQPYLKIICLECAKRLNVETAEFRILTEGVEELARAIEINQANKN